MSDADPLPQPSVPARLPLPHRSRPCAECPWRRDTEPGQFPAHRYQALANTSGSPGAEAPLDAPMFACHKSPVGAEQACAGWLAAVGYEHLGVRLAVVMGSLPETALQPGPNWPDLFDDFTSMANTQGHHDEPTVDTRPGSGEQVGGGLREQPDR